MLSALIIITVILVLVLVIAIRSYLHKRYQSLTPVNAEPGVVHTPLQPEGSIIVRGELWLARSKGGETIPERSKVRVVGAQDHLLVVSQILNSQ